MRSKRFIFAALILPLCKWVGIAGAQAIAFPSAEGFGAGATGGRGGEVYVVTSLADAGPGSFRDAVSKHHRTVVFAVGGVIRLRSDILVSGDITIAGQSAPGEGICLYGRTTSISGQQNIIIRYMRFREGIAGAKGKCAINAANTHNIILDHCSIEWGRWDCMGLTEETGDITVQNSIIGEGVDPQKFGSIIDSATNITLSHNLWIHNLSRNPKCKGTIQYINNVIYDWGITGLAGGHSGEKHELDAINNYLIKGPSSNNHAAGEYTESDHVYQTGNFVDLDRDGKLNGRLMTEKDFEDNKGSPTFLKQPSLKPPVPVTVDSVVEAFHKVVAGAGASLHRDAVDHRLIEEVLSLGTKGAISESEADVGGQRELAGGFVAKSTLNDGIPNQWKIIHHLDPKDAALFTTIAPGGFGNAGQVAAARKSAGYTYLEVYLNELAGK